MKKVLTIAGSDPSGGAGIQADLKVFRALRVYGFSVIAALTAQNTSGVYGVMAVGEGFVRRQLGVLLKDVRPDAVKIGMLSTSGNVDAVAWAIRKFHLGNVVLDPVIRSSSGRTLADAAMPETLRKRLIPRCTVITPNLHEASLLAGMDVRDREGMAEAARLISSLGPKQVIITGGHLEGEAVDLFYDGTVRYLRARRVPAEYHGTGCVFSSAVASFLARGYPPFDSARRAKEFMRRAFLRSFAGSGKMLLFDL